MTSEPVAVLIVGLYLEVEVKALGNFSICITVKIIIGVWGTPLRMIKMMNALSEEIPRENGSGTF